MKKEYNKEVLKERIRELHDKYHPEAIFMTQTSSTLYGWAIKEAWKEAWPEEKVPRILTINTKPIEKHEGEKIRRDSPIYNQALKRAKNLRNLEFARLDMTYEMMINDKMVSEEEAERLKEESKQKYDTDLRYGLTSRLLNPNWKEFNDLKKDIQSKLLSYNIKGNIALIDENWGFAGNIETAKNLGKGTLKEHDDKLKDINVFEPNDYERYSRESRTLGIAFPIAKRAVEELGYDSKVVTMGLGTTDRSKEGPWTREGLDDPTNYRRARTKSEKEKARNRIEEYKILGKDMGREIKQRRIKKINLESHIAGLISIASFFPAALLMNRSLTANVVGINKISLTAFFLFFISFFSGITWFRLKKLLHKNQK